MATPRENAHLYTLPIPSLFMLLHAPVRTMLVVVISLFTLSSMYGQEEGVTWHEQQALNIQELQLKLEVEDAPEAHFQLTMELCDLYNDLLVDSITQFPEYLQQHLKRAKEWGQVRTPRLNSVLELLLNIDRGFGENKKGRTLKNLEFSPLVEPGGVEPPSKQATKEPSTCLGEN